MCACVARGQPIFYSLHGSLSFFYSIPRHRTSKYDLESIPLFINGSKLTILRK